MKNLIHTLILSAAAATTLSIALPAQAATSQDDVQACRTAMTEQGYINMDNYRLRFIRAKGNNKGRTLTLKAIPHSYGQSFQFTCSLKKAQVVALNTSDTVLYAKR